MSASLRRSVRFYFRHLWRACFLSLRLADVVSTRWAWIVPTAWVGFGALLGVESVATTLDSVSNLLSWWTWKWPSPRTAVLSVYMIAFLRSIWEDYDSVAANARALSNQVALREQRSMEARIRLRRVLEEGEELWPGKGPTDAQEREWSEKLQGELRALLVNPTWEEFKHRAYNKHPQARSAQARVMRTTRALAELVAGLNAGDLRDPETGPLGDQIVLRSPKHTNIQELRNDPWPSSGPEALLGWSVLFQSLVVVNQSAAVARLSFRCRARVGGDKQLVPLVPRDSTQESIELAPQRTAEVDLRGELRLRAPDGASLMIEGIEVEDLAAPGTGSRFVTVPINQPLPPPKPPPPPAHLGQGIAAP